MSGIYKITCGKKCYIGSSAVLARRRSEHWSMLQRGVHSNKHLQRAWNKHGEGSFQFTVILYCEPTLLIEIEQQCVNLWRPAFNGTLTVFPNFYKQTHSPETREKMRQAKLGKRLSITHRQKLSERRRGRPHPISPAAMEALIARNKSAKQIAAVKMARAKQRPLTIVHRERLEALNAS